MGWHRYLVDPKCGRILSMAVCGCEGSNLNIALKHTQMCFDGVACDRCSNTMSLRDYGSVRLSMKITRVLRISIMTFGCLDGLACILQEHILNVLQGLPLGETAFLTTRLMESVDRRFLLIFLEALQGNRSF